MYEITDSLQALMERGFQFAHNSDSSGELVSVVGVRVHHNVIDIVQLFGEDDADAVRMPSGEPDILFPRTTLWRSSGRADAVIEALLGLADPAPETDAPPLAGSGCWVPVRPGRAKWLAADSRAERVEVFG